MRVSPKERKRRELELLQAHALLKRIAESGEGIVEGNRDYKAIAKWCKAMAADFLKPKCKDCGQVVGQ